MTTLNRTNVEEADNRFNKIVFDLNNEKDIKKYEAGLTEIVETYFEFDILFKREFDIKKFKCEANPQTIRRIYELSQSIIKLLNMILDAKKIFNNQSE